MNNQDFDRLLDSIRQQVPDSREAAERVRERLQEASANDLCSSFRLDFAAMKAGTLPEGRRMLLEDHLHSCVVCRREFSGVTANVVEMPRRAPVNRRFALVAAAAVVIAAVSYAIPPVLDRALAPEGPRGTVASIEGSLIAVSDQGAMPLKLGAALEEGQPIRTGKASRAVIRLNDGSLVEMSERSELALYERWRSKTVQLARGNVIVEAAKQKSGRLEVKTSDALVSVKGTIFGVSTGLKGSRVSVVEGAVQVDENAGGSVLLHRGDQKVTNESMARTAVVDDIAWSQNAAKYIALLADLQSVGEQISRLPMPGLRYTSLLLDRVPPGRVVVAALPNLGNIVGEAQRIFDDKARQSPAMSEWWSTEGAQEMRKAMEQIRAVSSYLGSEIIVAIPKDGEPLILAEVKQDGLAAELTRLGFTGPLAIAGNIVAIGSTSVPEPTGFTATPFGARILSAYKDGAGILFAANMEQIFTGDVSSSVAGIDNLRFVVAEQKGNLNAPIHNASLSFNGARHGVVSWLAAPGPMGSLEFVSKEATFSASFVTRDPRQLLEELIAQQVGDSNVAAQTVWQQAGVNVIDDLAGSLGGEATIAFDGAIFPTPTWKLAIEVDNAERLQWSIDQLVAFVQREDPQEGVSVSKETVDGRTFYTLIGPPMPVHYTFVDGYWLLGSSRATLIAAIQNRAAGLSLPRSAEFRAQLPADGHSFFSGLVYYNMGSTVGPIADQLKASGMLTPEMQSQIDTITANRTPGLVYVYGEPDQIRAGSRSNLFSLALQSLAAGNFPLMPTGVTQ